MLRQKILFKLILILLGVSQNETCKDAMQNAGKIVAKYGHVSSRDASNYNQLVFSIEVTITIAIHTIILSIGTCNVVSFGEKI